MARALLQLVPQLGHLPQVLCTAPRRRALVSAAASPSSGLLGPGARSLRGFVVDTAHGRALCLFGPLSLQVWSNDGVQGKSSADGGPRRASRRLVSRLDLSAEES